MITKNNKTLLDELLKFHIFQDYGAPAMAMMERIYYLHLRREFTANDEFELDYGEFAYDGYTYPTLILKHKHQHRCHYLEYKVFTVSIYISVITDYDTKQLSLEVREIKYEQQVD